MTAKAKKPLERKLIDFDSETVRILKIDAAKKGVDSFKAYIKQMADERAEKLSKNS